MLISVTRSTIFNPALTAVFISNDIARIISTTSLHYSTTVDSRQLQQRGSTKGSHRSLHTIFLEQEPVFEIYEIQPAQFGYVYCILNYRNYTTLNVKIALSLLSCSVAAYGDIEIKEDVALNGAYYQEKNANRMDSVKAFYPNNNAFELIVNKDVIDSIDSFLQAKSISHSKLAF